MEDDWNVHCSCERCKDPTELGCHTNTVLCKGCGGSIVPCDPLAVDSVWMCENCRDVLEGSHVETMLTRLQGEVEMMIHDYRYDVQSWLDLESEAVTFLHPHHGVMCEIARWCVPIMARGVAGVDADIVLIEIMRRKLRLAENYLTVLDIVEPGLNKTRGKAMYEVVECSLYLDSVDVENGDMSLELFRERSGQYLVQICEVIKILELFGTKSSFETMMLNSSKNIESTCVRYTSTDTKADLYLTSLSLTDTTNIVPTAVVKFYESWAHTYDSDMNQLESEDASCLTSSLTSWLALDGQHIGDVTVLDVAAGTGLVGENLYKDGYRHITALDISKEMLEKAENKGVYENLILSEFGQVLENVPTRSFNAVVMRGGFAAGHLPLASLRQMAGCCKQGGIVINCMVLEFAQTVEEYKDIDEYVEDLDKEGVWKLLERKVVEEYCRNKTGLMHCLKVL